MQAAHQLGAAYSHWEDAGGLAVAPDAEKLLLASGRLRRLYDFADIRTAGLNHAEGTASMNFASRASVIGAVLDADLNNGITIEVKDIDHPTWHMPFKRRADIVRWREILQQTVMA